MTGRKKIALLLAGGAAVGAAAIGLLRRGGAASGTEVEGGVLMTNVGFYDRASRLLLGPFFTPIATDVATAAPAGGRVLEVGCGPGLLSVRMARRGLEVTGLDLDPAMIERARANASRERAAPSFVVGDAAALPFPDASFDVVVSTLSLHHWSDPAAGLAEIARVLRVGGRALIWDFRPGASPHPFAPPHMEPPKATDHLKGSGLELVSVAPWRWPWRFTFIQRTELRKMEKQKRPLARKRSKSF